MRTSGPKPGDKIRRFGVFERRVWGSAFLAAMVCSGAAYGQSAVQSDPLKPAEEGGFRYFLVKEDDTPLRSEPYLVAQTQTLLPKGTRLANLGCVTDKNTVLCEGVSLTGKTRGFVPASHLEAVAGVGDVPLTGPDDSIRRARAKDFDFEGPIKCAQNEGDSLGNCKAQIARAGGGDATVIVTFGNSFTRELYFRLGEFMRANATMSGVGKDMEWTTEQGTYRIRVDDQRFAIPTAYILGQ